MAEYRQGVGPNRLPQGGAAQVNAATPPAEDLAGTPLEPGGDIPVVYARGEADPVGNDDNGLSEEAQVLLAPPNPGFASSLMPSQSANRVPRYVVRNLPILMAAASDPEAPVTIRALYNAVVRRLEAEMRQGR